MSLTPGITRRMHCKIKFLCQIFWKISRTLTFNRGDNLQKTKRLAAINMSEIRLENISNKHVKYYVSYMQSHNLLWCKNIEEDTCTNHQGAGRKHCNMDICITFYNRRFVPINWCNYNGFSAVNVDVKKVKETDRVSYHYL